MPAPATLADDPLPLDCQRGCYALEPHDRYLNAAAVSPQLLSVSEAGIAALRRKESPRAILEEHWLQPVQGLRTRFAGLIGAPRDWVATIPSVSYGMASVAKNAVLAPGRRVVSVAEVFPSTYYTWSAYAKTHGTSLELVAPPAGDAGRAHAWNVALLDAIDPACGLVCVPPIHWSDGTIFDLVAVREACDRVGALLVVDGTQFVGARPFDLARVRPDALVCAGYKWLGGPYTLGYLYLAEHFHGGSPLEENWMCREGSEDFSRLTEWTDTYRPGAMRFAMGEQSHFINVAMANVALEQLAEWRVERVAAYTEQLVAPFWERFEALGYALHESRYRAAHLFGLSLDGCEDVPALKAKLQAADVAVSFRGRYLRVSVHVSTRAEDLERLCEVLEEK